MKPVKTKPKSKDVAYCRPDYNHLVGEIGVRVADLLVDQRILQVGELGYSVTKNGGEWFESLNYW